MIVVSLYIHLQELHKSFLLEYQTAVDRLEERLASVEAQAQPIYYPMSVKSMFRALNLRVSRES